MWPLRMLGSGDSFPSISVRLLRGGTEMEFTSIIGNRPCLVVVSRSDDSLGFAAMVGALSVAQANNTLFVGLIDASSTAGTPPGWIDNVWDGGDDCVLATIGPKTLSAIGPKALPLTMAVVDGAIAHADVRVLTPNDASHRFAVFLDESAPIPNGERATHKSIHGELTGAT